MPKQDTVEPVDDWFETIVEVELSRALLRALENVVDKKIERLQKSSGRFSAINTLDDVFKLAGKPGTSISKRPMVFMKPWRVYSTARVNWQLRLGSMQFAMLTSLVQRFRETKSGRKLAMAGSARIGWT